MKENEYIEFVTHMLDEAFLKESNKSIILNALEKIFGDSLYSETLDFIPTNKIMDNVFDILNEYVFNNSLPKINVMCIPNDEMQNILNKEHQNRRASDYYAMYLPVPDWKRISSAEKCQMPLRHYLIINITGNTCNISFAINSLCHEMIHYLDTISGDILFQVLYAYKNKLEIPNEHNSKVFQTKMSELNKNNIGLTIIPDSNGENLSDLCQLSVLRMKRLRELEERILSDVNFSNSHMSVGYTDNGELYSIAF